MENVKNPKNIPLIILEKNRGLNFWQEIDQNIIYFILNDSYAYEKLVDSIKSCQQVKKKILIDLQADPHPRVVNLFKEIAEFGKINLKNENDNLENILNILPGSILVVAQGDFIANKITYKNFYNLFDSALRID